MPKVELTQERLKELLHYDPETGVFLNKTNRSSRAIKNYRSGTIDLKGYRKITINHKVYSAHSLAFLYMEGYFPENDIDHKDRNKDNNAWDNLRHVTRSCNIKNSSVSKRNKTGITGVNFKKACKLWRVQISGNGEPKHIGYYRDFSNAVMARWEAEKKYNFPNCNTTSTAYNYLKESGCLR